MTYAPKTHRLGIIGTFFGCLAFLTAALHIWALPIVMPPDPVDKVVVDTATKIKDRMVAKVTGSEFKEAEIKKDWNGIFSAAAVTFGVLAIVFAAISFVARESRHFAAAAATLGTVVILLELASLIVISIPIVLILLLFLASSG